MNLIYLLDKTGEISDIMTPIMTAVGYVIFVIKIIIPIVLVIWGMIALAQAVISQDEGEIKKAQSKLVKKVVAAILIYLVVTLVRGIMDLVGAGNGWEDYAYCAFEPFDTNNCYIIEPEGKIPGSD